jgi:2-polyprenyl-6-methoxyphenol hydroxylase-like FAD-dependent oxidoreductase
MVSAAEWSKAYIPLTFSVLTVGYKCLFGCSTREAGDSSCDMIETHNVNFSFQLLSQPERVFWFLYVKLDNSARGGTKYTAGDAETLAEQYLHHPITPTLTFQTLWKHRIRVTLADLEQGIQQRWYNGRIVLVGDAAHKMTPNLAFGFNTALESATALTNHLKTALAHSKSHTGLDLAEVDKVFSDYQIQRFARAKRFCDFANLYTRFAAWQNPAFKWASKFAPKVISDDVMVNQFAKLVKGGVKLDFIEVRCKSTGTIKFDDEC